MSVAERCAACRCLTTVEDDDRTGEVVCWVCRERGGVLSYPESVTKLMGTKDGAPSDWEPRMSALVPFDVLRGYGDLSLSTPPAAKEPTR